ncbi:uncharacterized protein LOC105842982 isoform X1 [Bombyx mori]|uniref:Uncharacterized protein n=1 Tax=Bombyx mori TaxID=7091 RepID=A0A8R2GDU1_BOMMO|nr:uncharacterized protein LOC105842982 isoform X1 [Bombyx mori]
MASFDPPFRRETVISFSEVDITMKMGKVLLLFSFFSTTTKSESNRERRFLTFHTLEEMIKVDLDLTIPFITIPIKKSEHSSGFLDLPVANINPAGLALGGAVVLGTTVILPFLAKSYTENHIPRKYFRVLDDAEFGSDVLIDFAGQMLNDKRNLQGCALRIACWMATNDYIEPGRVFEFIVSNKLLSMIVNSTAVEDAMLSGLNGRDCVSYRPCPLRKEYLDLFLKNAAMLINKQLNFT